MRPGMRQAAGLLAAFWAEAALAAPTAGAPDGSSKPHSPAPATSSHAAAASSTSPHAATNHAPAVHTQGGQTTPSGHAAAHATAAPLPPLPPPKPVKPASPLPFLPSVSNVQLQVTRELVVLTEEVRLPLGDYAGGDLAFYVSLGPVAPLALDARLSPDGALAPGDETLEDFLPTEFVPHAPPSARLLLGRPHMAGVVLRVKEASFRRATRNGSALLRVRSVLPLPPPDSNKLREVVARLGAPEGLPITLSQIEARGEAGVRIEAATAHLCGPGAIDDPLRVWFAASDQTPPRILAVPPENAVRNSSDDLCILYRASP